MAESNTLNYISLSFVSKNIQRELKTRLPIRNEFSIQRSQYYIIPLGTLNSTNVRRLPITTKETVMLWHGFPCLEYFIIEKHVKGGDIKDKRLCKVINKKNAWLPQQPLVAPQLFFSWALIDVLIAPYGKNYYYQQSLHSSAGKICHWRWYFLGWLSHLKCNASPCLHFNRPIQ